MHANRNAGESESWKLCYLRYIFSLFKWFHSTMFENYNYWDLWIIFGHISSPILSLSVNLIIYPELVSFATDWILYNQYLCRTSRTRLKLQSVMTQLQILNSFVLIPSTGCSNELAHKWHQEIPEYRQRLNLGNAVAIQAHDKRKCRTRNAAGTHLCRLEIFLKRLEKWAVGTRE